MESEDVFSKISRLRRLIRDYAKGKPMGEKCRCSCHRRHKKAAPVIRMKKIPKERPDPELCANQIISARKRKFLAKWKDALLRQLVRKRAIAKADRHDRRRKAVANEIGKFAKEETTTTSEEELLSTSSSTSENVVPRKRDRSSKSTES